MIINFIAYLDPYVHHGGGEQITSTLLDEGKKRGHTITTTYMDPQKRDYAKRADLNILWDIYNCPERNAPFSDQFIQKVTSSEIPYVYGTGGYEDICALGTLPCMGETDGATCNVPRSHRTFGEGGIGRKHPVACPANRRASLFQNAELCVFFSEMHRDLIEKVIGKVKSFIAIPPVQGLEDYYDTGTPRDIDLMSYGGHLEYKGFFNILDRFPDRNPLFIGGGDHVLPRSYSYGSFGGRVPQEHMPSVLNRVKTFVHLPRWPEPYGITTLQAALCGCEVIENENSIVLKDTTPEELAKEMENWKSCGPIWDKIEKMSNDL